MIQVTGTTQIRTLPGLRIYWTIGHFLKMFCAVSSCFDRHLLHVVSQTQRTMEGAMVYFEQRIRHVRAKSDK